MNCTRACTNSCSNVGGPTSANGGTCTRQVIQRPQGGTKGCRGRSEGLRNRGLHCPNAGGTSLWPPNRGRNIAPRTGVRRGSKTRGAKRTADEVGLRSISSRGHNISHSSPQNTDLTACYSSRDHDRSHSTPHNTQTSQYAIRAWAMTAHTAHHTKHGLHCMLCEPGLRPLAQHPTQNTVRTACFSSRGHDRSHRTPHKTRTPHHPMRAGAMTALTAPYTKHEPHSMLLQSGQ